MNRRCAAWVPRLVRLDAVTPLASVTGHVFQDPNGNGVQDPGELPYVGVPVVVTDEAGVGVYYLGLGPVRVDPLPEVFGSRRSRRIRHVEELPRVLAHVHRELVSA